MKRTTIWIFIFLMSSVSAFASEKIDTAYIGGETGNGGDGLIRNDNVYLLDLVEAGVELAPYFNKSVQADERINSFLKNKLPIDNSVIELISRKTKEIYLINSRLAYHILSAINLYNWQFLNTRLKDIPDDGDTIIDLPVKGELVQIAVRYKKEIKIDKKYWLLMDDANRASLILHEVLYSLIQPHISENGTQAQQSSLDVRRFVGFLLSERFDREILQQFLSSLDTRDPYPRISDLGGSMSPKSAVKNVNSKYIGVFHAKYKGVGWYTAHASLFESTKDEFCKNPLFTEFKADLWIPFYLTFWYPQFPFETENRFLVPNGYFSWGSVTQFIEKDKNYDQCISTLNKWKVVDPLDHLL